MMNYKSNNLNSKNKFTFNSKFNITTNINSNKSAIFIDYNKLDSNCKQSSMLNTHKNNSKLIKEDLFNNNIKKFLKMSSNDEDTPDFETNMLNVSEDNSNNINTINYNDKHEYNVDLKSKNKSSYNRRDRTKLFSFGDGLI